MTPTNQGGAASPQNKPNQNSNGPVAPTKRSLIEVASPENKPSKKIKHANSNLPNDTSNGEHLNKLWKSPMLTQHGIVLSADNRQDLESCITSTGMPKKVCTGLNVCSLSAMENNAKVFPEDVDIEILARLPVESLLRFRCVSKSWCALITSPTFIKRHLRQQKKGSVLLIRRRYSQTDIFSFHNPDSPNLNKLRQSITIPFLKDFTYRRRRVLGRYDPRSVWVLGPCDGLVCISHYESSILCNPALREFKLLPACRLAPPPHYEDGFSAKGFGRASNGDFKVVLIRVSCDGTGFYVYNSRTNAWRGIDYDLTVMGRHIYMPLRHLFFNGACHWHAMNADRGTCFPDFVLSFDINTEVIRRLELPDCLKIWGDPGRLLLTNINECLAVVRHSYKQKKFQLWVMREYGVEESWTKQYVIRHDLTRPLELWKNGKWLLCELNGQLACFASDPVRKKGFKIYGDLFTFRALLYEESLISVNKLCSSEEGVGETGNELDKGEGPSEVQ